MNQQHIIPAVNVQRTQVDFRTTTDYCCWFLHGTNPTETLSHCNSIEDKENLKTQIDHYNTRDVQFLYFVVSVFIATFVGTLFSFAGHDSIKVEMRNLVIWISCFTLFMVGMRVYFFRLYIQNSLISTFKINGSDIYDKIMNLIFVILCLLLVGTFVAMFKYASDYEQLNSVIAMCVLIGLAIITTGWYKLIIRRISRRVVELTPTIAIAQV